MVILVELHLPSCKVPGNDQMQCCCCMSPHSRLWWHRGKMPLMALCGRLRIHSRIGSHYDCTQMCLNLFRCPPGPARRSKVRCWIPANSWFRSVKVQRDFMRIMMFIGNRLCQNIFCFLFQWLSNREVMWEAEKRQSCCVVSDVCSVPLNPVWVITDIGCDQSRSNTSGVIFVNPSILGKKSTESSPACIIREHVRLAFTHTSSIWC